METYLKFLESQVDRAIYVRGAQGQNVLTKPDPEGWIREMETTRRSDYAQHIEEYNRNADRAIALFRKRRAAGISPIRAFDCSGLTVYYADDIAEIVNDDYSAAGIYNKLCTIKPAGVPTYPGQLIFKSSNTSSSNINHMATYVGNGQIIECRGRDYGVIRRAYNDSEWQFTGEWPELMRCCYDPAPVSALDNGEPVELLQRALNALGLPDNDFHPLDADGKFGKKTAAALERLVRLNTPELHIVLTGDGSTWAYVEK